jgi:hypothetical protein
LPVTSALEKARAVANQGIGTPVLLDFLCRAAGLAPESAATLLRTHGLVGRLIEPKIIQSTHAARAFWRRFNDGEIAYGAGVAAGEFVRFAGRWAYFESNGLSELLPGIYLPQKLRRLGYLVRLVEDNGNLELDLHGAPLGYPLTRHPCGPSGA